LLRAAFGVEQPLIGMVHLQPLPGSPRFAGDFGAVIDAALRDAEALAEGGFDGCIVENFGDRPFFPDRVPEVTVAAMAMVTDRLVRATRLPVGVNVLRNDAMAALAIAAIVGARFIRVNVLAGAMVTDQGLIQGRAHEVMRTRAALGAKVMVLADVLVKHAAPLGEADPVRQAADLLERAGADALIVTGRATGEAPSPALVQHLRESFPSAAILVGSGVTPSNAGQFLPFCDGLIVGTCLKAGGAVSVERVRELVSAVRGT
jgi:membrane complex biogenesis BtpA family protein